MTLRVRLATTLRFGLPRTLRVLAMTPTAGELSNQRQGEKERPPGGSRRGAFLAIDARLRSVRDRPPHFDARRGRRV